MSLRRVGSSARYRLCRRAFNSLNSLQLHDTNDAAYSVDDAEVRGDVSPEPTGADSPSDPDPGLDSPYMGAQRHLAGAGQELGAPTRTPATAPPSPPPARTTEQPRIPGDAAGDGSEVVVLVFSSLAALVLLGVAIAAACLSQLLRSTVLKAEVWRSIARGRGGGRGGVDWPAEKAQYGPETGGHGGAIAARAVLHGEASSYPTQPSDAPDPADMPLPENVPASSAPAVRGVGVVLWTYDHWVTHLMMALFGWLGMFFRGTSDL